MGNRPGFPETTPSSARTGSTPVASAQQSWSSKDRESLLVADEKGSWRTPE